MLTRDQILAANDLRKETVEVPAWGGSLTVREATALERDEYEESILTPHLNAENKPELKPDFRNSKAKLLVKCIIGENGERLFSDKDVEMLGQKSAQAVDLVFQVIRRLSGMTLESKEELEKNLGGAQTESLPSS
jgi:hypothetical protein